MSIKKADLIVDFVPNEPVGAVARASGFRLGAQWSDLEWPFAENLLVAV